MLLRIGPYRAIYEARLEKFQACGYPQIDAAALAQSIVAQPLPEVALSSSSGYLEATGPSSAMQLEWNNYESTDLNWQQIVDANKDLNHALTRSDGGQPVPGLPFFLGGRNVS
jgi:hypothetical protein